uniref:Uncharacterized protein n=1 Tax=Phenylobacterium glaciei TaxID=2803784 RepID=A0A974P2R2_9CAUL|nr:hypothetical protein JKL49_22705 [Phenylobacterium glaciei]
MVFCEEAADAVRQQLLGMEGVLVWVDPIATASGQRRGALDDILREVAQAGCSSAPTPT